MLIEMVDNEMKEFHAIPDELKANSTFGTKKWDGRLIERAPAGTDIDGTVRIAGTANGWRYIQLFRLTEKAAS